MDPKELQEKIALYFSKLPPDAQEVFSSMKWLETLQTISLKYNLNQKQQETLSTETTLVLLGIIHLVEYEENLTNELGLERDPSERMLVEIQDSILKNIRPQLIQAFDANQKVEIEETQNIEQGLDKRFTELPKEIKDVFEKSQYKLTLYNIEYKNKLTIDQMGDLEKNVTNLINGSINPNNFQDFIEKDIKLSPEVITKLINDLNEKIFLKIRESLKLINTPTEKTPEKVNDSQILNSAGIEIVPEKLELPITEKLPEKREEILKKIENPDAVHPVRSMSPQGDSSTLVLERAASNGVHPILVQKLSSSMQTPMVKTEHTLNNLTPSSTPKIAPKIDPYREIPE